MVHAIFHFFYDCCMYFWKAYKNLCSERNLYSGWYEKHIFFSLDARYFWGLEWLFWLPLFAHQDWNSPSMIRATEGTQHSKTVIVLLCDDGMGRQGVCQGLLGSASCPSLMKFAWRWAKLWHLDWVATIPWLGAVHFVLQIKHEGWSTMLIRQKYCPMCANSRSLTHYSLLHNTIFLDLRWIAKFYLR